MQGNVPKSVVNSDSGVISEHNAEGDRVETKNVRGGKLAYDHSVLASPSSRMLLALNATGRPMYQGTVPAAVKAKRRAGNKAARKARRV